MATSTVLLGAAQATAGWDPGSQLNRAYFSPSRPWLTMYGLRVRSSTSKLQARDLHLPLLLGSHLAFRLQHVTFHCSTECQARLHWLLCDLHMLAGERGMPSRASASPGQER